MTKVNLFLLILLNGFLLSCAKERYVASSVESSRVEMNSAWDAKANPKMTALVESYKAKVQSEMDIPIGTADQTLQKGYPQSLLGNFTADAMKEIAEGLWGHIDFAVINIGGLRAILNEGTVTIGNMYEIYPFDNQLILLELRGKDVKDFFDFIAFNGGGGLSTGIQLTIQSQNVQSLEIGGNPLDENKIYRIATIDFLAQGNDGMTAFKQAVNRLDSNQTLRDLMIQYIKDLTAKKQTIHATLDNRIAIIPI
ncbi:MAG: 5'-nucleotidase C-terminal domain-containing protein [Candidatus Azobacteroides sp.]|nr:5'-nucleotidase C-terminal domain-containing protein [Candidatus Azobacteroides sp.]